MDYSKPSQAEQLQYIIDAYTSNPTRYTQDKLLTATRYILASQCPDYMATLERPSSMSPNMSVLPKSGEDPATIVHRFEHAGQRLARKEAWAIKETSGSLPSSVEGFEWPRGGSKRNHEMIVWGLERLKSDQSLGYGLLKIPVLSEMRHLCEDAEEDIDCLLSPSNYPKTAHDTFQQGSEILELQRSAMADLYRNDPARASAIEAFVIDSVMHHRSTEGTRDGVTAHTPSDTASASAVAGLAALRLLVDARCKAFPSAEGDPERLLACEVARSYLIRGRYFAMMSPTADEIERASTRLCRILEASRESSAPASETTEGGEQY